MDRMVIASIILTACTAASRVPGPGAAMRAPAIEWEGCFDRIAPRPTMRICGTLTLERPLENFNLASDGQSLFRRAIPLQHTFALTALVDTAMHLRADALGPFGSISPGAGGTWELQVGFHSSDVLLAVDDGSVVATMNRTADTLAGNWSRTCYGGCTETGTVRLTARAR